MTPADSPRARLAVIALVLASLAPAGAQVRPPSIVELSRSGIQRGTTAQVTVFGVNLKDASAAIFDDARITARIIGYVETGEDRLRPRPNDTRLPFPDSAKRGELTIEVTAAAEAPVGEHLFRIRTPIGTTASRPFEIGALPESIENEPNDETPQELTLPLTLNGEVGWPSDVDTFTFEAAAGQQLVLSVEAAGVQSRLDSTLTLRNAAGDLVATNDDEHDATRDALIVHTVAASGRYGLALTDAAGGGGANAGYRLSIGAVPYLTSVFPLGGLRDRVTRFTLSGANLTAGGVRSRLVLPEPARRAALPPPPVHSDIVPLDIAAATDMPPLNELPVARGVDPEVMEQDAASGRPLGQLVTMPVTVNGRIDRRADGGSADTFRILLRKGQRVVASVAAARLGSPLDASLEILDLRGRPVPRAIVRPVWQTSVDLRDRGSMDSGLRLLSWSELRRGDYIFVDRELMRVRELPKGPDEDVALINFRGRRFSYEGTSGEGHALGRPVYKVEIHRPGSKLSPNGLPTFELTYRNDDGGPFYGKDPHLDFEAPAAGEYLVRITDSRNDAGPRHAYRLTIAPPRPDFTLAVSPMNPNVPRGSRIPVNVFAFRHDGFDGPIDVELKGLPPSVRATTGTILPGHTQVAVTLEAGATAEETTPFSVHGRATIAGRPVSRVVDLTRSVAVVSISEPPPVRVVAVEPARLELRPGESARVRVTIARDQGFKGRVPIAVLNLPFLLTIPDIGLNGILITEQQESREFTILADERAEPVEQTLYVTARAEVNSTEPVDQASTPIRIRVLPRRAPEPTTQASR